MARIGGLIASLLVVLASCQSNVPLNPAPQQQPAFMVLTERRAGGRLIAVSADGDRQHELIETPSTTVIDQNAAVSPDGRWVAFQSTRGRAAMQESSLWLAPVGIGQRPTRLTHDPAIDLDPTWTADGASIVFSSNRAGTFDLWEIAVSADGVVGGPPRRLTEARGNELGAAVAANGTIAYASVDQGPHGLQSVVEVLSPDGRIVRWTAGPGDTAPGWLGEQLVYASAHVRDAPDGKATVDADLAILREPGGTARWLLDLPGTDERWAVGRDGWLFATSVLRAPVRGGDTARELAPLWSTVIAWKPGPAPTVRAVVDRAGATIRMTPALLTVPWSSGLEAALTALPDYHQELIRTHGRLRRSSQAPNSPAAGRAP